jgi:hypothetical protein
VELENKSDTGNNRGDWNLFKFTQTITEQRTWKARNFGIAKTAKLGTAHILREVLMLKYTTYVYIHILREK